MSCSASKMEPPKAAIVVIGDEILKGQVTDTNSPFMSKHLYSQGVRVIRITVVPDDVSVIAEEVRRACEISDWVITCGGIGPTHDDVTYEGIAKALGQNITKNTQMSKAMKKIVGIDDAGKMAQVPEGSQVFQQKASDFPVIRAGKVFILPGIPQYCESAFFKILKVIAKAGVQFFVQDVRIKADELCFLSVLNRVVDKFIDRVTFGSYPYVTVDNVWHTRITLESTSLDDLCIARTALLSEISPELWDMALTKDDAKKVVDLGNGSTAFAKAVADALQVIEKSLEKYVPDDIILSFNGGKDCTVLMHLVWAVFTLRGISPINTLYVETSDTFPEITTFIESCQERYQLSLIAVQGPIKPALVRLEKEKPHMKAVWMGTRRSDPYSGDLKAFQMCDKGWPKFMRVNPLLDWTYQDVWTFLRSLAVPYCSLYDEGYTSLGNKTNTDKNAALFDKDTQTYKPAYMLTNGDSERNGRA